MSESPITIPTLLREKLGKDFDAEDIWGYKYTSGYWEEDETSWDCPIGDFIEEPEIHVFVINDKKEQLVTIRKKDILSETDTAFENLHQWLTDNYGNDVKTGGVFGVVKENGKYKVEFGQGRVFDTSRFFHSGMMIEKITKLLPEGFDFIGDEKEGKWQWEHHGDDGNAFVICEIMVGFSKNHRAYYHFDIWHETDNSLNNSSNLEKELDAACRSIARMLSDEYPDYMHGYILVMARYVDFSTMEEIGRVEFDVPLNYDETRNLRRLLFSSVSFYPDNLRWLDRELFHKIEKKAEIKVAEAFQFDPIQFPIHIVLHWAEGERQRLIGRYSSLTEEDIQKMITYIDGLDGKEFSRYELLKVRGSFVWKEVWTRETGHMWEKYTLLKRTPSDEELDYADCSQYAVWLDDLSTETIVKLFKEYKSKHHGDGSRDP